MQKILNYIANTLWVSSCALEHRCLKKSLKEIKAIQRKILLSILKKNADTAIGKKYGFSKIKSVKGFQENVPLSDYEDYAPYIDRIAAGEKKVLTHEPVLKLEPSSGTTSSSKYIPYTKSLKKEFQRAVKTWIYDLYSSHLNLLAGKAYWSVTPVVKQGVRTRGGIEIGFEEDCEYLGLMDRFLLKQVFAVPSGIKQIENIDAFKYVTLLFLLKAKTLSLISVWNPTFLTLLLEPFEQWKNILVKDLKEGTITLPKGKMDEGLNRSLKKELGRNRKRSDELFSIINQNSHDKKRFVKIWPKLKLISCWDSANAEIYVPQLKQLFPGVEIQGKGLIATEGIISFPLFETTSYVPAVRSHFLEFIEYDTCSTKGDNNKALRLINELETGKTYSVVITTGGGFYRYKLHDLIRVAGNANGYPSIQFVGKEDNVSDYFGEKLNEIFVHDVITKLFKQYKLKTDFYMAAPEIDVNSESFYTLFIKPISNVSDTYEQKLITFSKDMEEELKKNYYYKYCRELGQLGHSRIFIIEDKNPSEAYLQFCKQEGQRVGDIKPIILHTKSGWSGRFKGEYLQ